VLALSFRCNDDAGLFGSRRRSALWPIGVLAATADVPADAAADEMGIPQASPLSASIVAAGERFPIAIASDTSHGMLTTGVVLLDLSGLPDSPAEFTLEFRAPRGLVRPPRVLWIGPNVIPIEQGQIVVDELHIANGLPNWTFVLNQPGLQFKPGAEPIQLDVAGISGRVAWQRCDRLSQLGPNDPAFEFDLVSAQATFGNGINGRIPDSEAQVLVTYRICDGEAGNVAPNRRWIVTGIQGIYGSNASPVAGGSNAPDTAGVQRDARGVVRDARPLITADDIVAAAKALPLLEVGRAWVLDPPQNVPSTGTTTLVAMRTRPDSVEPAQPPETPLWLNAIRRSLSPRMPLSTRLTVIAPQYVSFTIVASLESLPGENPQNVKADVEAALRAHWELVPTSPTAQVPGPGVPVSRRDVAALIRSVAGVGRILKLLLREAAADTGKITIPRGALARFDFSGSRIDVARPAPGGGAA
jgi:predicted phage baseplate assembly protein